VVISKGKVKGRIYSAAIRLLQATAHTWSAKRLQPTALHRNLNMGDTQTTPKCDGRTGLSPLAAYPYNAVGLEANKGNLRPKDHIYAVDSYSSIVHGYLIFIRGPLLEYPLQEWTMILQMNNNKSITLPRTYHLDKLKYLLKRSVPAEVQGRREADKSGSSPNPSPHILPILMLQSKVESLYFFFSRNVLFSCEGVLLPFYSLRGRFLLVFYRQAYLGIP
jgi:hypothetical protein